MAQPKNNLKEILRNFKTYTENMANKNKIKINLRLKKIGTSESGKILVVLNKKVQFVS